jgi:hypothetical protein
LSDGINAIPFYRGSSDTDDNAVCSLLHLKDSSHPSDYVSDSNDSEKSIDVPISIPFETRYVQKQEYTVDSLFSANTLIIRHFWSAKMAFLENCFKKISN